MSEARKKIENEISFEASKKGTDDTHFFRYVMFRVDFIILIVILGDKKRTQNEDI